MNNNDNADKVGQPESISSNQINGENHLKSNISKAKTKGTGFLRSNSPKNKQVPSLLSASTLAQDNVNKEITLETQKIKITNNKNIKNQTIDQNLETNINHKTNSTKNQSQIKKTRVKKEEGIIQNLTTEQPNQILTNENAQHLNTSETSNQIENNSEIKEKDITVKKFEKPNPYRNIQKKENKTDTNRFDKRNHQQKYKKPFAHQQRELTAQEYEREKEEIALEVIKEHPPVEKVLSLIRQRTGFVASNFWNELDLVQASDNPIDLKSESSTIINYAVLFNKEEIYSELLEKYHSNLVIDDFHGNLIAYCANKSSYFLDKTIVWYDKLFHDKDRLANLLIDKLCHCSFRQENNFIWLSWLDKNATNEILNKFWNNTFEFKNVVLMLEGLHFKRIATYLKNHMETFSFQIENCSKTHQILSNLKNPSYYVDRANEHLEMDLTHRAKEFELSLLEQVKDKKEIKDERKNDRKEDITTEVIIKKKKSYDPNGNTSPSPFL